MSTWVLLRGLMRESRHWGDFPARLQQAMGGTVVTPDLPGNGMLHWRSSPSCVQGMTEACRNQLQSLGHTPPYRVLAMSLGAMVAVDWATRYPHELQSMVLINTSLAPYSPFYQRLRPENYLVLFSTLLFASPARQQALILRLTSNHFSPVRQAEILALWNSYAQEFPVTRANALRQLYAAARYHAAIEKIRVAVILLSGQQDRLVDCRCSETLAERWACLIRRHPTAGHDLPLDDGDWVVQQVKDWLDSQSPSPLFE